MKMRISSINEVPVSQKPHSILDLSSRLSESVPSSRQPSLEKTHKQPSSAPFTSVKSVLVRPVIANNYTQTSEEDLSELKKKGGLDGLLNEKMC